MQALLWQINTQVTTMYLQLWCVVELFHAPLTRVHDMTKPNFSRSFSFLFACIPNRESNSLRQFIHGSNLFKTLSLTHIQKQNQTHSFTPPIHFTSNPVNFLNRLYSQLFQPNSVIDLSVWKLPSNNIFQKQKLNLVPNKKVSPSLY